MNERDTISLDGIELGGIVVLYGTSAQFKDWDRVTLTSMLQPGLICT